MGPQEVRREESPWAQPCYEMKFQFPSMLSMTCARPPHCTSPLPLPAYSLTPNSRPRQPCSLFPCGPFALLAPLRLYRLFPQLTGPSPLCNQLIPSPSRLIKSLSFQEVFVQPAHRFFPRPCYVTGTTLDILGTQERKRQMQS